MLPLGRSEVLKADLLVVGGGLAGCWAALKARQKGLDVLLADKGRVGETGCSRFASGDFKSMPPGGDFDGCMEKIFIGSGYLGHQQWIETALKESFDRVEELESLGIHFVKDNTGGFLTTDDVLPQFTISSTQLMPKFREVLEKAGVRFLDRWFLHELLLNKEQQVSGAVVISTRENNYCVILCKAVILAAGSCSLRAAYFGHQFSTGDGYAAAVKAGATLVNMEAVNHNVSLRDYDTTGGAFFREHGVKYRNCRGEEFIHKYKGLPTGHAMAFEVKESKGPVFMDISAIKSDDFTEAGEIMPWLKLILERAKIDDPSRVPCVAAFCGSRATGAGVYVSIDGESIVDGLFATGDAGAMLSNGMGAMGINLMTCSVFGSRCGMNAARYSSNREMPREDEIEGIERGINVTVKGDGDLSANTLLAAIQKAVLPLEVVLIKEESRLKNALGRIEEIREEMLPLMEIHDIRSLIRVLETENMLLYCEAMFKSSLERRESRRLHYREDYPNPDNKNWCKWVKASGTPGNLTITTEDIPRDAFKYLRPPTD